MSVKVAVPLLSSMDGAGTPIQLDYRLTVGSRVAKHRTVTAKLAADQTVTLRLARPAAKTRYTLAVTASDDNGQTTKRTIALVP
jgi:hypothetical protein